MLAQLRDRPGLVIAILKYEHHLREKFEQMKAIVQSVGSRGTKRVWRALPDERYVNKRIRRVLADTNMLDCVGW